jgi:hypothetical protein
VLTVALRKSDIDSKQQYVYQTGNAVKTDVDAPARFGPEPQLSAQPEQEVPAEPSGLWPKLRRQGCRLCKSVMAGGK